MGRFRLDSPGYPEQISFMRSEFERRGWAETKGDDWDFFWSFDLHDTATFRELKPTQKINHFPGIGAVHFKDELARYLQLTAGRVAEPGFYDFVPETYSMVRQYDEWRAAAAADLAKIWLLKPTQLTGGRGMRILESHDELSPDERGSGWIVQRYVDDPLLLPDAPYKHTFRIYALVTSFDPLIAYLYSNGPVKFTSRPFSLEGDHARDMVRHLTNPSVQLTNTDENQPVRLQDWPEYRLRLAAAGLDGDVLWARIRHAVIQALIAAARPVLRASQHRTGQVGSCYELLGYDITVDSQLRPWVLECNASPSLGLRGGDGSPDQLAQQRTKQPLIVDTLTLLGVNRAGDSVAADFTEAQSLDQGSERTGDFSLIYPAADEANYAPCVAAADELFR